ncbi:hypothetical protein D3C87_1954680 [compost metagenome]
MEADGIFRCGLDFGSVLKDDHTVIGRRFDNFGDDSVRERRLPGPCTACDDDVEPIGDSASDD